MRLYEITVHPKAEARIRQTCEIVGRVILTSYEKDNHLRLFCATPSNLPEILDFLGGVTALKDITNQLEDRHGHLLY